MSIFTRAGNLLVSLVTQLANAATGPTSRVMRVLSLDVTGKVAPAGEVNSNAPFVKLTDGSDDLDLLAASAVPTTATITVPTKPVDTQGNVISGGGGTSGGLTLYTSPVHFAAAWQDADSLDLAGMAFTIDNFSQFVDIEAWNAAGAFIAKYSPKTHVFGWDAVNDRVSVTGAAFVTGGTHKVSILAVDRTVSLPSNMQYVGEVSPYELRADDAGVPLITVLQAFTNAWVDCGPEIAMFGKSGVTLFGVLDINDDSDLRIRALAKHEGGGTGEHPLVIEVVGASVVAVEGLYYEFTVDADQLFALRVQTNGEVPYLQIQILRGTDGSGVDAEMDSLHYIRGTFGGAS